MDIKGVPDQEGVAEVMHWKDMLSGVSPDLEAFKLRDPDHFSVGPGLHQNVEVWNNVLEGHPLAERIGGWIRDKVDILLFSRPLSAVFKRASYSSDWPPRKRFPNLELCRTFSDFISRLIINRVSTGAF